jgi:phosphate transport system protein
MRFTDLEFMENARHFELELDALRQRLLDMGARAERAALQSVQAVIQRDDSSAVAVETGDDVLDRLQMEIDEESIRLLSKAPLASDLRLVSTVMKIADQLERVGDEASTIARRAIELDKEPVLDPIPDLTPLVEGVAQALKTALDCFTTRDMDAAAAIVKRDRDLDELNRENRRNLTLAMTQSPQKISRALHWITISKSLERIGDHAKAIAQFVVYLHQAHDIRHVEKL